VVGRCVGATTRAVVGGWVVVGRAVVGGAVVGGAVVVEAAVVGAAVVGGAVVVEAAEKVAVLAGGVGGLATNPTRPSRDTRATAATGVMICSLRYHGRSARGRGGGGAPHCGGGVDPAGGWTGGGWGCGGPQPCGFTHRSGTAGLPSTEREYIRHYKRLRQSDRYGLSAGQGDPVTAVQSVAVATEGPIDEDSSAGADVSRGPLRRSSDDAGNPSGNPVAVTGPGGMGLAGLRTRCKLRRCPAAARGGRVVSYF
jgi:hypothetical protein